MPAHLVTAPVEEPIDVGLAKAHLRLESTEDDAYISGQLIPAARLAVEEFCFRGLVTQTWELVLPAFPTFPLHFHLHHLHPHPLMCRHCQRFIELPFGQLAELEDDESAVTSLKYIDATGAEITLDPSLYDVDSVSVPGQVLPAYGLTWPAARAQWNAVKVTYVVGWDAVDVPQPITQAMLLLISQMYEKRNPEPIMSSTVQALLAPYRLLRVA